MVTATHIKLHIIIVILFGQSVIVRQQYQVVSVGAVDGGGNCGDQEQYSDRVGVAK